MALAIGQKVKVKIIELDIPKRRVNLSIKQTDPEWKEVEEEKNEPKTHSSQSDKKTDTNDDKSKRQKVEGVDESLDNILQELKDRGIGNTD